MTMNSMDEKLLLQQIAEGSEKAFALLLEQKWNNIYWQALTYVRSSSQAQDIVQETGYYNKQLAGGKWDNMMSMKPRDLPVYLEPVIPAISIDSTSGWSISPEGYVPKDSSLLGNNNSLSLPSFDVINKQKYFIDIFLNKNQTIEWTASVSHKWIHLTKNSGLLSPERGKSQIRIWVNADWNEIKTNEALAGTILFKADGRQMAVNVQVTKRNQRELSGYNGFIEDNGFISIYATHFTRQTNKALHQWKRIDGLGYTGNALQALPLTITDEISTDLNSIGTRHSFVEYDFYTFTSANPFVTVFTLPTHPLNNNYSMRYALSIDQGPLKIIDFRTFGRSDECKQDVLRNRAERKIEMPFLDAGKHTLRIYCVDPGVILDEIRIDLGGLKKAYSVIPETRMTSPPQSAFK